jgi:hypothetical protein
LSQPTPYAETLPRVDAERAKSTLATDSDSTFLVFDLESHDGSRTVRFPCTVRHQGETVTAVNFEDGWKHLFRAAGIDPDDADAQGYVAYLAKRLFWGRP